MLGIIAPLPAVKSLWADIKMAAGKTAIMAMHQVIIKPL
jgi:hypothetical protein